jgi:aminomethyltransferase
MNKTILYAEHERLKANIVPFGGFLMPLFYSSIATEHDAVRQNVGIFDVSHMGEILIKGPESLAFVNQLVTNLIPTGPTLKATYALMCNEFGHVIDDLFVYPLEADTYLLVVNAANVDKDEAFIRQAAAPFIVTIENASSEYGQIALQGPNAFKMMMALFGASIDDLKFMQYCYKTYDGHQILVSRSGYTGEDGFELYAEPNAILKLWRHFVDGSGVTPCGLGCRDTLRFEGALSLYGHEIDDTISPLEAGLKFAVNFNKEFTGKEVLLKEFNEGVKRKLVGLDIIGRGIARADYEVYADGAKIGKVTTGYLLPHHQTPLALALIDRKYCELGTMVQVSIRNQLIEARVRDTKFMDKKYKR